MRSVAPTSNGNFAGSPMRRRYRTPALLHQADDPGYGHRIELGSGVASQLLERIPNRHCGLVGTDTGHRIKGIRDLEHPGLDRYLRSREPRGVTGSVVPFMVGQHYASDLGSNVATHQFESDPGMAPQFNPLAGRWGTGLVEDLFGYE